MNSITRELLDYHAIRGMTMMMKEPLTVEVQELYAKCQESLYCRTLLQCYDDEHMADFKIRGDIGTSKGCVRILLDFQDHLLRRKALLQKLLENAEEAKR